jgi:hypothetical protein
MLARQYQFGEFQGEDAGSAIVAKVAINYSKIAGFAAQGQPMQPINEDLPLETLVERLPLTIDTKTALRCGKMFLQLLDEQGASQSPASPYTPGMYRQAMAERFAFRVPKPNPAEGPATTVAKARQRSQQEATAFTRALAGRAVNATALYTFLGGNAFAINQLVLAAAETANTQKFVHASHQSILQEATSLWLTWLQKELNLPQAAHNPCWKDERLEYAFTASVNEGNGGQTELSAEQYAHGHLDWYNFDVQKTNPSNNKRFDENIRLRECFAFIPTEASFAGAPHNRWWQMEDGSVDIANLKASETDLAKILVSQYALQYSTDWLAVPYELPTGSFSAVEAIVVKDTFGYYTLVEAAHKNNSEEWNSFNLYSLTRAGEEFDPPGFDKRLLLPPSVARIHESEAVELVKFIRDEMANMVWGIEKRVPNGLGGGLSGEEAANNLAAQLKALEEVATSPESITLPQSNPAGSTPRLDQYKAPLKYTLGNSVPENWIPFIAAHKPGSNREIHFQRASMPRITALFEPYAVRPRSPLLRKDISDQDQQQTPYFLEEEEIPRAGAVVKGTYQRARWYGGKVVTWFGRRKQTGRGEGSSGLRFDVVGDNE